MKLGCSAPSFVALFLAFALLTYAKPSHANQCKIGGCGGQLCVPVNDPGISTCIHRAEYACYKRAHCRQLKNGQCGWVMTQKLRNCLKSPPGVNR